MSVDLLLQQINAERYSHELVVDLFETVKSQLKRNHLPCQVNKDDPKHRYHSCGGQAQLSISTGLICTSCLWLRRDSHSIWLYGSSLLLQLLS